MDKHGEAGGLSFLFTQEGDHADTKMKSGIVPLPVRSPGQENVLHQTRWLFGTVAFVDEPLAAGEQDDPLRQPDWSEDARVVYPVGEGANFLRAPGLVLRPVGDEWYGLLFPMPASDVSPLGQKPRRGCETAHNEQQTESHPAETRAGPILQHWRSVVEDAPMSASPAGGRRAPVTAGSTVSSRDGGPDYRVHHPAFDPSADRPTAVR